ncbi:MAG TPA: hypothetical protein ENN09_06100, partial [Planctomycetes bacterium]|nr:hypothetical protein [Planctomycetota bacterium]
MKHVRLLAVAAVFAGALHAQAASPVLIDSFDTGEGWKVLPGSDPAALFVSSRLRIQGSKSLGVRIAPGTVREVSLFREFSSDLSGEVKLSVAVYSPEDGLSISLLLAAGAVEERRFISRAADLAAGWQRVDFQLNREIFSLLERPGVRVRPSDLNNLRGIGFVFHNPRGVRVEVFLDALAVLRSLPLRPALLAQEKPPPELAVVGDVVEVGARVVSPGLPELPLQAVFRAPSGVIERLPAFSPGDEDGWWVVRFRPRIPGEYSYHLVVESAGGVVTTQERRFSVKEAAAPKAYSERLIGLNVAWAADYSPYLRALASNGADTVRIWLSPWGLNLEESPGVYSPAVARRIDGILAEASRLGIGVILTLVTSGEFTAGGWSANPYNRLNGGPCFSPAEFFTNEEAVALFERRTAYCMRRWGAYPSLAAIEPAGDLDAIPAPDDAARIFWLRRISSFIEREDVYRRRVFVGLGALPSADFAAELASVRAVDAVGVHFLGGEDPMSFLVQTAALAASVGKRVFIEEYGGAWRSSGDASDPDGLALKAGLWAGAAVCGSPPLPWWWDSHIMSRKLF